MKERLEEGKGRLVALENVRGRIEDKVRREVTAFKWGVGAVVAAQFGGMAYFVLEVSFARLDLEMTLWKV